MSLPEAFAGTIKFAPVGTDLSDTDSWVDLASSIESVSFGEDKAPNPLLDILNGAIATAAPPPPASAADIRQNVLDAMQAIRDTPYRPAWGGGLEVIQTPAMPRGKVAFIADGGRLLMPEAEYREFTEAEYEGIRARRIVRHGMADILRWLGEDVGPEPDAPLPVAFKFFARTMIRETHYGPGFGGLTSRMIDLGEPI